jgi:hypothetical protein
MGGAQKTPQSDRTYRYAIFISQGCRKKKKHVLSSRMQVGVAQLLTQQLKEFLEYSDMRINVTPVEMLAIFFF